MSHYLIFSHRFPFAYSLFHPENRHLIWHSACTAGTRLKLRLQSACNKRLDTGSFNCTFVIQGPQPLPLSFPVVLVDKLAPKDPKPHFRSPGQGFIFFCCPTLSPPQSFLPSLLGQRSKFSLTPINDKKEKKISKLPILRL